MTLPHPPIARATVTNSFARGNRDHDVKHDFALILRMN
jgi:hypothetical protein